METFALTINAIDNVLEFDYIEALNSYMNTVEQACYIVFNVIVILWDCLSFTWHNGGKSAAIKVVAWFQGVAIPFITESVENVYQAGGKARYIWERVNSPLFIML